MTTPTPTPYRRPHSRPGFTLIEAIVTLVILSVAIPSMLFGIRDATAKRSNPVLVSQAHWLASEKLEDIIADRNSSNRGYTYIVNGNYSSEANISGFTNMARSVSISETSPTGAAGTGLKTVTVTVTYTDAQGSSRSVTVSTALTDYTP